MVTVLWSWAGYLFGPACYTVATEHPEVLFLALDVTEGDLKAESVPSNIALICYQEEQAGYLAGYAAVQEGYKELGFLGGIDVPRGDPVWVWLHHGRGQGCPGAESDGCQHQVLVLRLLPAQR